MITFMTSLSSNNNQMITLKKTILFKQIYFFVKRLNPKSNQTISITFFNPTALYKYIRYFLFSWWEWDFIVLEVWKSKCNLCSSVVIQTIKWIPSIFSDSMLYVSPGLWRAGWKTPAGFWSTSLTWRAASLRSRRHFQSWTGTEPCGTLRTLAPAHCWSRRCSRQLKKERWGPDWGRRVRWKRLTVCSATSVRPGIRFIQFMHANIWTC